MKICTRCKELKPLERYGKKTAARDGLTCECKVCNSYRARKRREIHSEQVREWTRSWRLRNKDHIAAYEKANRASATSRLAKYRASKLKATVQFEDIEFNDFVISEFYDLAKLRTAATKINWHVDHIVPLQSEIVCGFHYYTNLRVITAKENQMKSNKYWKDMP